MILSEFMAINNTTLADEDGSYSDWIEIFNGGTNTVNLEGWYLSDDATDPTKWSFPATNLGPNQFLVVFASDKDRRVPGAPLHTNFKLSGDGEYLGLIMPDGVTRASEFSPAFPQQYADIPYGYLMTGTVATLVAPEAAARALVPASDIGPGWRFPGYNDSTWLAGPLGTGFDTSGNYAPAIGTDLQTRMLNVNASAYLRVPFAADNPEGFNHLTLGLRYDDGFVAWLNGTEVLRRNAPSTLTWNAAATATHGGPNPGTLAQDFESAPADYSLSQYGAGPAPAVQAADQGSTGRFLRLLYDGVNSSANTITFDQTAPGLFGKIIADFDFRISSAVNNPADGFAFMLIPTALYGRTGPGVNISSQSVEEPNYPEVLGIGFDVYPHATANDVSAHWDGSLYGETTIPSATLDLAEGVFHHAKVTLEYVASGARVTVTLTRDVNGNAGTPYSPITDRFIPGLEPFDCRVEFGGRTGGLNLALDLDNCNVQFVPPPGPMAFENFDLSSSLHLLNPGQNLLAFQGLNISAGNSNFLVQPELIGRSFVIESPPTYLYPATPGIWNDSAGAIALPPVVTFSPPGGVYTNDSLLISMSAGSSSGSIHYTLDGSTPGGSSPIYADPIRVSTNATFRARADAGGVPSPVTSATYIFLDSSLTNFTSNLPLVIIDTLGQVIPDGSKIGSYAIFLDTNTPAGRTSLLGATNYAGRLGIGLHGSSSLGFPKKPYTIEVDDETGDGLDFPLLGQPSGSDWLLYPSYDDKTFMNNVLTEEIFAAMGHYAVRCKYTELFLRTTPGKLTADDYLGIYVLQERIRVDKNRVDIAELTPSDNALPDVSGGYLFFKDRPAEGDLTITTTSGQELIVLYPKSDKITQSQIDYLLGYLNDFEAALYGPNWLNPLTGYKSYIDVSSFVDQHWIVEYSKNIDGYRLSNFMNKDRNRKLNMEPIWDWDLSWGNANYFEGGRTNGWYYTQLGDDGDIWLHKIRTDPDFFQRIIDRWAALRLNVFNPTNILARVDQITNYLWEAQARDFARWPRLGTYIWPNPDGADGGWDVDYVNPTTYDGIISQFKKYIRGRYLWIDQQFVPAPTLVTNGAVLSMSAPVGSIFYTLDNTDPRASGGGPTPLARLYTGPITLTNNAGVFARASYTNAWSAPARALYVAALPPLRITEINYHPAPPPTNSLYDDKDFEFIEIQNTGSNIIDLANTRLGGGIDFTFVPNEFVPVGTATSNRFDGAPAATPFTASTLGQPPGPYLSNEGPLGNLLCLLNSGTNTARNRITFNQTATGGYDRLIADFDFRAAGFAPATSNGAPTLQDFDNAGTTYTLSSSGSTLPGVLPADAGSTGSFLRLVPGSGSQLGTGAFNRTARGPFDSIVATFDFRISPPAGVTPADGLGFALLSTASYGSSGSGPNFSEEPNLANSIGIGFDVYNNGSTAKEPNNNHLSLHWNGTQVGNAYTPSFNMANGRFHRAQILVWFWETDAYVTVRLTPDINGSPGPIETVLQNAVIPGAAPYQSRVAFGARTGGAWAAHDIDNVDVRFSGNTTASSGLSLLLLPAAQFGVVGPGTTLASFSDWPMVPNTLALDFAFNPSNLVNDVSLYWNSVLAVSTTLPASALDLDSGVFHHARLELDGGVGGAYASLTLTPDVLGIPGAPINVFSNLSISGPSLGDSRLEFAARNGGLQSRVDLENILVTFESLAPMLLNPGESIVVVHNLDAFISRYGTGIRVAGEFSGSLANEGEHLTLVGPVGEPILDFIYDPAWFPATDGGGFSLVAVDPQAPTGDWGLAQNWRPSSELGGSPGSVDGAPPLAILTAWQAENGDLGLAWPAAAGNLNLYSAISLDGQSLWLAVTNPPALAGDQWLVTLPPTNHASFYRLLVRPVAGP